MRGQRTLISFRVLVWNGKSSGTPGTMYRVIRCSLMDISTQSLGLICLERSYPVSSRTCHIVSKDRTVLYSIFTHLSYGASMRLFILVDLSLWKPPTRRRLPTLYENTLANRRRRRSVCVLRTHRQIAATHFVPGTIKHYGATDWHACLVLHKSVEGLLMVVTPLFEEGTRMKQHGRELLERQ